MLRAVAEELPEAARQVLATQVPEVNLVQRFADGMEVNLYRRRLSFWPREYSVYFPNRQTELALSKVELSSRDSTATVAIWAVRGAVFSLQFSKPPAKLEGASVRHVTLLEDPLEVADQPVGTSDVDLHSIATVIRVPEDRIRHARPPLDDETRQQLLSLGAPECDFPADWLALTRLSDGLELEGARIHGIRDANRVVLEGRTYMVLVEGVEDCCLALDCSAPGRDLVVMDYEGTVLETAGATFATALRTYLDRT